MEVTGRQKWRAGSKEQGAKSREQRAGSMGQRAWFLIILSFPHQLISSSAHSLISSFSHQLIKAWGLGKVAEHFRWSLNLEVVEG
jgi:hypothetical protein